MSVTRKRKGVRTGTSRSFPTAAHAHLSRFQVTAEYWGPDDEYEPSATRSCALDAPSPERAAVEAVTRGVLPREFLSISGRQEPIFWRPELYVAGERWPEVVEIEDGDAETVRLILAWGNEHNTRKLALNVRRVESLAGGR